MGMQGSAATAAPAAPAGLETVPPGQHDAADAAMYREMRAALSDFDASGSPKDAAPRHRAFFAALRSVLGQVLEEKTAASRHTRLLAAHRWCVKHKPRPKPADMDMAAAMAASLSVSEPADTSGSTGPVAAGRVGSRQGGSGLQLQQPSRVAGVPQQQLFSSCEADADEHQPIRSNTSRWREQQVRLHDMDDHSESECTAIEQQQGACSLPGSPQWQQQRQNIHQGPGHLGTFNFFCNSDGGGTSSGGAAAGRGRATSASSSKLAPCLPEQPSLRQVPAIQAVQGPQQQQQQQHWAASSTGQTGRPSRGSSPVRGMNCSSGCVISSGRAISSAAGNTDGLIPLGSLPSGRLSPEVLGGSCSGSGYAASRAQWSLVAAQQQQVESDVAAHMRGYARYRARLEEEISRKQETAAQLAAAKAALQQREAAGGAPPGDSGRVLLHLDSQHQPSAISTYQRLAPAAALQLVPVDKVKEAKKQLMQEGQREVAEVAAQLSSLGIAANTDLVMHALLPLPDMPYMHCMAHLPKPGATATGTSKKVKVKKAKKKVVKKGQKGANKQNKTRL